VRLAALDLRRISGLDLEVLVVDLGILRFCVSSKFTCFLTFCINVAFLCKFRRIRVLGCTSEFITVTIPTSALLLSKFGTLAILVKNGGF